MMLNLTKVRHFGPTPLWSRTQIHKSTYQNRVSSNLGKLQVGIEPNISRSTAHPKPPTTGRHPDRSTFSVPWLSLSFIFSFLIGLNTPPPPNKKPYSYMGRREPSNGSPYLSLNFHFQTKKSHDLYNWLLRDNNVSLLVRYIFSSKLEN